MRCPTENRTIIREVVAALTLGVLVGLLFALGLIAVFG